MSFACKTLCGHKLHRPHLSCLWCRVRRLHYGKMDKTRYHYNRYMHAVIPLSYSSYALIIDNQRKHAKIKAAMLKRLLTICEWLAN